MTPVSPPSPSSSTTCAQLERLPPSELERLRTALAPRLTRYIQGTPTAKQAAFLWLPHLEALYGGAASGGKSWALLASCLQYVDVPDYAALLCRRTFPSLRLPGGLYDRARLWLQRTPARYSAQEKSWIFPTSVKESPARLTFGFAEDDRDLERYASSEFQTIALDETTQFTPTQYKFFFSRLRKPAEGPLSAVPLRLRGATNPGSIGHEFIRARFVRAAKGQGRVYIPARLEDNPHVDRASYELALAELDPVTRARLREGDWDIQQAGPYFNLEWLRYFWVDGERGEYVLRAPQGEKRVKIEACRRVGAVDLASSTRTTADFTVISSGAITPENELLHIGQVRERMEKPRQMQRLRTEARVHRLPRVLVESVAYQATFVQDARVEGLPVVECYPDGNKGNRFTLAATYMQGGRYYVREDAPWREDLESELVRVDGTDKMHDDQADALSYLFSELSSGGDVARAVTRETPAERPQSIVRGKGRIRRDALYVDGEDVESGS